SVICTSVFLFFCFFFFFQAEDGIRDLTVTGVQTCALPILSLEGHAWELDLAGQEALVELPGVSFERHDVVVGDAAPAALGERDEIGRASCRERVERPVVGGAWKKK